MRAQKYNWDYWNIPVMYHHYSLKYFEDNQHLICAYEDLDVTRGLLAQVLFGGVHTNAKLPITASDKIKIGTGLNTDASILTWVEKQGVKK